MAEANRAVAPSPGPCVVECKDAMAAIGAGGLLACTAPAVLSVNPRASVARQSAGCVRIERLSQDESRPDQDDDVDVGVGRDAVLARLSRPSRCLTRSRCRRTPSKALPLWLRSPVVMVSFVPTGSPESRAMPLRCE